MGVSGGAGTNPLERFADRLTRDEPTCPECGYRDEEGSWRAETTGDRVVYRHLCPSCGAMRTRELRLGNQG
jgi:ribosomal protein S27AE